MRKPKSCPDGTPNTHFVGLKLLLVLTKIVKDLLPISNLSRGILGLDDYIIHIGFYIMTDLLT